MAKSKPKAPVIEHSEDRINATIRDAIPPGGVFWDYLTLIRLEPNLGANEFQRGEFEGVRKFAGELQDRALGVFEKQDGGL